MPDFQNPTGLLLDQRQRERLARDLARAGTRAVVDETFVELGLDTTAGAPLAAFAPGHLSVGSLSKAFWGGMWIGWVRAEADFVRRLRERRRVLVAGLRQLLPAWGVSEPASGCSGASCRRCARPSSPPWPNAMGCAWRPAPGSAPVTPSTTGSASPLPSHPSSCGVPSTCSPPPTPTPPEPPPASRGPLDPVV
jgi:Aminotransferase class I and II